MWFFIAWLTLCNINTNFCIGIKIYHCIKRPSNASTEHRQLGNKNTRLINRHIFKKSSIIWPPYFWSAFLKGLWSLRHFPAQVTSSCNLFGDLTNGHTAPGKLSFFIIWWLTWFTGLFRNYQWIFSRHPQHAQIGSLIMRSMSQKENVNVKLELTIIKIATQWCHKTLCVPSWF